MRLPDFWDRTNTSNFVYTLGTIKNNQSDRVTRFGTSIQ